MLELNKLVSIVNRNKVSKIEVIGNPGSYRGKMKQLYIGVSKGEFKTDDEAMKSIYGEGNHWKNYKKLKYRLEQRLLNTVFFIDLNKPSFNDTQKIYYQSYKIMAALKIIAGRGGGGYGIQMAERILPRVLDAGYTEIAVGFLQILNSHYGTREMNIKKFEKYSTLLNQQIKVLEAESKATQYDNLIKVKYFKRSSSNEELHKEANKYVSELRPYLKITKSHKFIVRAFNLFMNEHLLINHHHKAIEVCQEALNIYNEKEEPNKSGLSFFLGYLIGLYRQTRQYDKAMDTIDSILDLDAYTLGSNNLLSLYSQYITVCFHKKDYQKAYEIFHTGLQDNHDLRKNKNTIQNQYKLFEAFFHFFIAIEKVDVTKSDFPELKKFRLSKFLNDIPDYASDKRKHNITLIIIQVLFLLQQKKYGHVIDKVEALNMYCYRYLKKDDTFRSNCFIKLLLILPKGNFNRIAVERKSEKLLAKLKSVPLESANQAEDLEIIPYDDLWEMVLNMLGTQVHKVVKAN